MQAATARIFPKHSPGDVPGARPGALRLVANAEGPDHVLAQDAARGDMSALGILYERHNRYVYAICVRLTRNPAEAEDLTQEVFVHLLRKIGSFRGESRFRTWLYRLTVNLVLMDFRRRKVRLEQPPEDREWTPAIFDRSRQPSAAQLTNRLALESALEQLPPGCRAVLVLFDVAGFHHHEIANLLGCSAGTSKSQLHHARLKLRRLLGGERTDGARSLQRRQ